MKRFMFAWPLVLCVFATGNAVADKKPAWFEVGDYAVVNRKIPVNLLAEEDPNSAVVGKVERGEIVRVLSVGPDWVCAIKRSGIFGYLKPDDLIHRKGHRSNRDQAKIAAERAKRAQELLARFPETSGFHMAQSIEDFAGELKREELIQFFGQTRDLWPSWVEGDLNGDGKSHDVAILAVKPTDEANNHNFSVFVFHEGDRKRVVTLPGGSNISLFPKRPFQPICEEHPLAMKCDGIHIGFWESASTLYHWDGSEYKGYCTGD